MGKMVGKQSIEFEKAPYIIEGIHCRTEEGVVLGNLFDEVARTYAGTESWEEAVC